MPGFYQKLYVKNLCTSPFPRLKTLNFKDDEVNKTVTVNLVTLKILQARKF